MMSSTVHHHPLSSTSSLVIDQVGSYLYRSRLSLTHTPPPPPPINTIYNSFIYYNNYNTFLTGVGGGVSLLKIVDIGDVV